MYVCKHKRTGKIRVVDAVDRQDCVRHVGSSFLVHTVDISLGMKHECIFSKQARAAVWDGITDIDGFREWVRENRLTRCGSSKRSSKTNNRR